MGSASKHKQDNLILFFPMYVCLGVYYVIKGAFSPFIFIWNKLADLLYKNIKKEKLNVEEQVNMDIEQKTQVNNQIQRTYVTQPQNNVVQSNNNGQVNQTNNMSAGEKMSVPVVKAGGEVKAASQYVHKTKKNVKVSSSLMKSREALIKSFETTEDVRSNNLLTFRYTAVSYNGKLETGTFYAYSKVEVYTFLESEGYTVYKLETNKLIELLYGKSMLSSSKIKIKDIVFWLQQLSTYLKSGIPLTDAMRILTKQMGKNPNIRRTFNSIVYNLTLGESFSTCLEKQDEAFPSLLINMVRSAEATGDLEGTLDEMADYYSSTESTRKEMISALTYPVMIMLFSIGVVVFILIYLIPQFVGIYDSAGVTLNPITSFIIALSGFLTDNLIYILGVLTVVIAINVILYKNLKAFRYFAQSVFMRIPVIGKIIIYKEMMIFTKTFESLLKNNVFITESMDILGKVTNNEVYREIMVNTVNYIGRGEKISAAFEDHWAIPEVAYYMMVTGESTGELGEMMGKVSVYYAEQHKMIIDSMKSLIEPILIVFLAVVVGGIIISVIVPMFGLYSKIM